MKNKNQTKKLSSLIAPYLMIAILVAFSITLFFVFFYVFVAIFVIGLIAAGVIYLRLRFFNARQKQGRKPHKGRVINQDKA